MGFQIYQIEKSQAVNLLDRVADKLLSNEFRAAWDDDDVVSESADVVMALCRNIDRMSTELSQKSMTFSEIMEMLRNADDYIAHARGNSVEFVARYLTNYDVDRNACLYAAGYALRPDDQLLRDEEAL